MSDLYKEWQDVLREYINEQPPVDDWHGRYMQERVRLNKEYVLNQLSDIVEQGNKGGNTTPHNEESNNG